MHEFWVVFPLLSAFLQALRLAAIKQLSLSFSSPALTFFVSLASLLITLPLIVRFHHFPLDNPSYVAAVLGGSLLAGLGGWALNHAIQCSDLSLVGPLLAFTPVEIILIEWLLLGDTPTAFGFGGILLLIMGSYLLSLNKAHRGWVEPLRHLLNDQGSRLALIAGLCFALSTTLGRLGIKASDPLSFSVMIAIVNPIVLFGFFALQRPGFIAEVTGDKVRQCYKSLLILGLLFALMRIADQIALDLALASYVNGVKRTAGIFSVILGHFLFNEQGIKEKLAGSGLMVLGVLVLVQSTASL